MIDKKHLRLMNQELDGANSADESRSLKEYLAGSEEARTRYRELGAVMDLFRSDQGPAPTPDFKAKILDDIGKKAGPLGEKRDREVSAGGFWMRAAALGPMRLKYGLFFALGLCVGLLLLFVFKNRSIDSGLDARQLVGTVMDAKNMRPVENLRLDREGVSQELSLSYGDGRLAAEVRGNAAKDVEIVFTFDRDDLSFYTFRQSAGDNGGINIEPGRFTVRTAGPHGFGVMFNVKAGLPVSLKVQVFASSMAVFEKSLTVTKDGNR
jgi:hypothetical protein